MAVRYYPLIDKIMTSLSIRDKLSSSSEIINDDSFNRPFITVAREPGSGGKPIARAVAQKLGFEFIDEQIVDEIARSTKQRKAIIKSIDEKSRSRIEDLVHSILNREYVDDIRYVQELVRVVLAHACRGNVVILGRGGNFIAPFAKGLHINVTAPYAVRVQRAMDYEGHGEARAKEVIATIGQERKDFVRQYLKKNVRKRNAYDLTLNTTFFDVDKSRDVIIDVFHQKFPQFVPLSKKIRSRAKF